MRKDTNDLKPRIYTPVLCICKAKDHKCVLEYENDAYGIDDWEEIYGCKTCDHATSIFIKVK